MERLICLTAILLAATGCEKTCRSSLHRILHLDNQSRSPVNLAICKGHSFPIQKVSLKTGENGDIAIESVEEVAVKVPPGTSCDKAKAEDEGLSIVLNEQSLTHSKLCRYDGDNLKATIVDNERPCPPGAREQTDLSLAECEAD